jgi:DNA-binding response OmpR family regulator
MTEPLRGLRIMVVEDEFLVAMLIEEILESAGCVVSGPIPRLAEALDAARREACDAAVLDINLAGERIFPVADELSRRNIPFLFVTGYSTTALPGEYAERPRLCKPFKIADLLGALSDIARPAAAD